MALGGQVVDLVGPHLLDDADEAGGVREVAVVQDELAPGLVGVLVEVVDAIGVGFWWAASNTRQRVAG